MTGVFSKATSLRGAQRRGNPVLPKSLAVFWIASLTLAMTVFITNPVHASWYNIDWPYRVKVTVKASQVNGDLSNFPVYIDLSNLPNSFFTNVTASGGDIRVTKNDGVTEIAREVVSVDTGTTNGELHFKADTLSSSSDTSFYIYYGNSNGTEPSAASTYGADAVWSNGFVGVWHLGEDGNTTSGGYKDSSSFNNHGTGNSMTSSSDVDGKLAKAQDFDGSADYIIVSDDNSLDITDKITVSAWSNTDITPAGQDRIVSKGADIYIIYYSGNLSPRSYLKDVSTQDFIFANPSTATTWHHIALTYDKDAGANNRINYLDGTLSNQATHTGAIGTDANNLTIGAYYQGSLRFDGKIDEVRISNVARSANWISAEYNNQNSASSFYGISEEESKASWFNSSWLYRIPITINSSQVNGDLSNFPIYIDLNSLNGSEFFTQVRSDGGDIRITKSDGISQVARELVSIDTANGTGELHFVANGTLSASYGDTFYIYYGNSSATEPSAASSFGSENVWTENFVGVWHMNQSPVNGSAMISDSSANANTGTPAGNMDSSDLTTGKFGKAINFDGSNDNIVVSDPAAWNNDFSASLWIKTSTAGLRRNIIGVGNAWATRSWSYVTEWDGGIYDSYIYDGNNLAITANKNVFDNQWHHVVTTYDQTNLTLHIDNNFNTAVKTITERAGDLYFGGGTYSSTGTHYWPGLIDEIRISSTNRSVNWIDAEYNNQNSPNTFYSIGSQSKYTDWLDIHWTNRIQFTVQASQINGDLSNFPVYVDLNLFNGSEFFTQVRSDGGDIRITKADGISQVAREVVTIDTANGTGELHFVANGTLSSSTNGNYYIYYGNEVAQDLGTSSLYGSQNVWKNGYHGVWHLNEAVNNNADGYKDSSPNSIDLTGSSMALTEVQGKLGGKGQNFDGAADYLFKSGSSLNGLSQGSLSAWLKTSSAATNRYIVSLPKASGGTNGFDIRIASATDIASTCRTNAGHTPVQSTQTYSNNTWHQFKAVFNGSDRKIFFNGLEVNGSTTTGTLDNAANEINVARFGSFGGFYPGELDEIRISTLVRSHNWVSTEYNNQNSPSSFINVSNGSEGQNLKSDWSTKAKITIKASQVNGDLTNFPIYVDLSDLNGTSFFTKVKGNGADIRITKADKATLVPLELVALDTNNGTGELWFKAYSLSGSTDTDFYIWYGNNGAVAYAADGSLGAQQVWSSNFDGVWHLGEEGNTDNNGYKDSASLQNHGNGVSMTTASDISGQVGRAQDFDGAADYIQLGTRTMGANESFTISAWVYPRSNTGTERPFFSHADSGEAFGIMASRGSADNTWAHYMSTGGYQNGPAVIQNQWQYVVYKYDGTNRETFIDNASVIGPSASSHTGGTKRMQIARWYPTNNNYYFNGSIDEIRIADTNRTTNWINTEYNNQSSPNTFYEITEEGGGLFDWNLF